jgi:YfiH family protein
MIEKNLDGLPVRCFENLSACGSVSHFVSTRSGGASHPPYDGLNLSFNVGDDPKRVLNNRQRLAGALGTSLTSLTLARQVHDDHVSVVTEDMRGEGAVDHEGAIDQTDAMVTDVPGTCLMILLADCVPILLCDPSKNVVGVVHAGWKGTVQCLAQKTVHMLGSTFGCSPKDLVAGIGPSIGPCCYEVGPEVAELAEQAFGVEQDILKRTSPDGKGHFDLWKANQMQLMRAGIPEVNIELAGLCTYHHADRFYSYRHDKGKTGRFGAGIMLQK